MGLWRGEEKDQDGHILCAGELLIASDILALNIIRVFLKGIVGRGGSSAPWNTPQTVDGSFTREEDYSFPSI